MTPSLALTQDAIFVVRQLQEKYNVPSSEQEALYGFCGPRESI